MTAASFFEKYFFCASSSAASPASAYLTTNAKTAGTSYGIIIVRNIHGSDIDSNVHYYDRNQQQVHRHKDSDCTAMES